MQLPARKKMQMNMINRLSCLLPIVKNQPVIFPTSRFRQFFCGVNQTAEDGDITLLHLLNRVNMLLG